jgi:hypothetical protein
MSSREGTSLSLTMEELRSIADGLRDDLQRQANQGIRKKDWEQGIGSLASMEAVTEFLRICEQRARAYAEVEDRQTERRQRRAGANVTSLPAPSPAVRKRVKSAVDPADLPGWARERVK